MRKAPDQTGSLLAEAHTLTVEQIRRALISDNGDVRERFLEEFPSERPRPSGGVANQHEPAAGATVRVHRGEVVLGTHPSEDFRTD